MPQWMAFISRGGMSLLTHLSQYYCFGLISSLQIYVAPSLWYITMKILDSDKSSALGVVFGLRQVYEYDFYYCCISFSV